MSNLRRMRQLWRSIPTIACQGLCWDSCGPIGGSVLEEDLVRQAGGGRGFQVAEHPLYPDGERMCCHLSAEGRCSVYEVRPTICRIWGVTAGLRCHHGCKPADPLTDAQGFVLLAKALTIGGDSEERRMGKLEELVEALDSGQLQVLMDNVPGRATVTLVDSRPAPSRRR